MIFTKVNLDTHHSDSYMYMYMQDHNYDALKLIILILNSAHGKISNSLDSV